jgi:hypothetical protein
MEDVEFKAELTRGQPASEVREAIKDIYKNFTDTEPTVTLECFERDNSGQLQSLTDTTGCAT